MDDASPLLAKDLYELLEVSSSACPEVIQAAYRVLARTWHPDVNRSPDAPRRIRELNDAYQVLSDAQRRAMYDLHRARMRRRARVVGSPQRTQPGAGVGAARARAREHGARGAQPLPQPLTGERRSILSGQALLAIAALATLVALALVLLWVNLAMSDDPQIGDRGVVVDMRSGGPMPDLASR